MNALNNLNIILGFQLTMGLPEIIIGLLGALSLGFTIHFFWNSKKSFRINDPSSASGISENDNWKLKYYNDMDMQERAQQQLREKLNQSQEGEQILGIELEETRKEIESLRRELEETRTELDDAHYRVSKVSEQHAQMEASAAAVAAEPTNSYLAQLRNAQEKLLEHNNSIARLLEQTELLGQAERRIMDLQVRNEELSDELRQSQQLIVEKESEISYLRHQKKLAEEMSLRLDKAYEEYNALQEKLVKLQAYITQPYKKSADYDELKENYFKMGKEHDEMKLRHISLREENQRLTRILADTEEKLKEANFQRQQFQKRSVFLEELNRDLQEISEHNKKIESQLRRVSDMEAMLARITGSPGDEISKDHP